VSQYKYGDRVIVKTAGGGEAQVRVVEEGRHGYWHMTSETLFQEARARGERAQALIGFPPEDIRLAATDALFPTGPVR
jgi:hypothetical protein